MSLSCPLWGFEASHLILLGKVRRDPTDRGAYLFQITTHEKVDEWVGNGEELIASEFGCQARVLIEPHGHCGYLFEVPMPEDDQRSPAEVLAETKEKIEVAIQRECDI